MRFRLCDWQISLFIFYVLLLILFCIISVQNLRFACSCVCSGRDFQFCKLISVGKFQFSCLSLSVCFKHPYISSSLTFIFEGFTWSPDFKFPPHFHNNSASMSGWTYKNSVDFLRE